MYNKILGYNLLIKPKVQLYLIPLYKYNCTIGLINKLYPKTLLYMQPLHKIFVVIQNYECRLSLCKLLHFNP